MDITSISSIAAIANRSVGGAPAGGRVDLERVTSGAGPASPDRGASVRAEHAHGDQVKLSATEGGHFGVDQVAGHDPVESFGALLQRALGSVNAAEVDSYEKTNAMVATPDKVDIHDVMISFAKAQSAVNFTKAVTDRLLNIFRELTNLR